MVRPSFFLQMEIRQLDFLLEIAATIWCSALSMDQPILLVRSVMETVVPTTLTIHVMEQILLAMLEIGEPGMKVVWVEPVWLASTLVRSMVIGQSLSMTMPAQMKEYSIVLRSSFVMVQALIASQSDQIVRLLRGPIQQEI